MAATTGAANGLIVVHVSDQVTRALAGHDGCQYASPPQPREQALRLVALLLGCPADMVVDSREQWATSVAGGRRTITLQAAAP